MKISDILVEKTPHLSFEVFPPKTDAAYEGVLKATEAIAELKPSYMSVTYGAGGGTSKNTVKIASHIKDKYNVPSLAHLTCVSSTKEEVHQVIDQLKAAGIENILALRGDIPQESEFPLPNHYQYAYELIEDINLPERFKAIVDRFGDNPKAMQQAGIAYATDQIIDLFANGINHVHVYSMNKPEVAAAIQANLSEILNK